MKYILFFVLFAVLKMPKIVTNMNYSIRCSEEIVDCSEILRISDISSLEKSSNQAILYRACNFFCMFKECND